MDRSIKRRWFTLIVAAAAIAVGAAGGARAVVAPGFPITVKTAGGAVTVHRRPSRIVSLSASSTDDLFAVGAGTQVVAVDSYSDYPARAPRTHLSGFTPNIEAIAKYKPDLVLVSADTNHIVRELGKLGIAVMVEPAAANLNGVYAQIEEIGQATGHPQTAARVASKLKEQVQAIVRSVPRPAKPLTVYHELDQTYYSATSNTFIGQLYKLLGLVNIADKAKAASPYPQLSAEYIIASNPDLIVLADTVCCGQTRATVAARPGWSDIAAVKTGEVVLVNDSIASQWGTRVVLFLRAIASAVRTLEGHAK